MKKVGDIMLKEWLEKAGPEGKALIDAYTQALTEPLMRKALDALYDGAAALAALFMVGLLVHGAAVHRRAGSSTSTCPAPTPTPAT